MQQRACKGSVCTWQSGKYTEVVRSESLYQIESLSTILLAGKASQSSWSGWTGPNWPDLSIVLPTALCTDFNMTQNSMIKPDLLVALKRSRMPWLYVLLLIMEMAPRQLPL